MAINIQNTDSFAPNLSHKFFIDTNVWLYLYFPQHSKIAKGIINKYSSFFLQLKTRNCLVLTNLVQISEIFNLIIQLEFKQYKQDKPSASKDFKEFRNTPEFKVALANAKVLLENILRSAELLSGTFNSDEMKKMALQCDKADFNDIFFAKFCEQQSSILITHDFDFNAINFNATVITMNDNYLT